MQYISVIATIISEILIIIGAAIPIIVWVSRIVEGQKCQLRTAMLGTYYKCKENETIRQYERENFDKLYAAYKKLHGNSFIDDLKPEVDEWEIE